MKWKRNLAVAGMIAAFIYASFVVLVMASWENHHGITKANFDRIQKGMVIVEAEDIFDQPHEIHEIRHKAWVGDAGVATVFFDKDMRIIDKHWEPSSYLTRIRRMFR